MIKHISHDPSQWQVRNQMDDDLSVDDLNHDLFEESTGVVVSPVVRRTAG